MESSPGVWIDLSPEDYATQVGMPYFWDLPLKDDALHAAAIHTEPMILAAQQRAGEISVILLIGVGAIATTLFIVGFVLFG